MSRAPFLLTLTLASAASGLLQAAPVFESLYAFPPSHYDRPGAPCSPVILGSDGNYYGGSTRMNVVMGVIYRVTPAGETRVLHSFADADVYPNKLLQTADGTFYGTVGPSDPKVGSGSAFKLTPQGGYTRLAAFNGPNGSLPKGELILASDGNFYGTTSLGGSTNQGTLFRMTPAGQLTTLVSFGGANGAKPLAGLLQASDGLLYGTTSAGGASNAGTVFSVTTAGNLTTLHSFNNVDGAEPDSSLVQGPGGLLYGVTHNGGLTYAPGSQSSGTGTLFRISPAGEFESLHSFSSYEGAYPADGLTLGSDGTVYGTTSWYGSGKAGDVFRFSQADGFSVLTYFDNSFGADSSYGVSFAPDGTLYGIHGAALGPGLVFKMDLSGALTKVVEFGKQVTGSFPVSVVQAADGTLYGTTDADGPADAGTVFKLSASGQFTDLGGLPAWTPSHPPGDYFPAALLPGPDGSPVAISSWREGDSTSFVVKMDIAGNFSPFATLDAGSGEHFVSLISGPAHGFFALTSANRILGISSTGEVTPVATIPDGPAVLTYGTDGTLYGAATYGGSELKGSIFSVDPGGEVRTLFDFSAVESTGYEYPGSLIRRGDGTFFGSNGQGVFKLTAGGEFSVVASFTHNYGNQSTALVAGPDGNIYGFCDDDGPAGCGTIFRIAPDNAYSVIHHFAISNGASPFSLTIGQDGQLYGTTAYGGSDPDGIPANGGVVFRIRFDEPPSPLESWVNSQNLTTGVAGDDDHDGLSNLQEYAFGTDPHVAQAAIVNEGSAGLPLALGAPALRIADSPSGPQTFVFTRRKNRDASGLVYVPQFSKDLIYWLPDTEIASVLATSGDFEIVSVPFPTFDPELYHYARLVIAAP